MRVRAIWWLVIAVIAGSAMIGCGGGSDSSTGTTTGAAKAPDSARTATGSTAGKTSSKRHRQGAPPKTTALSAKQRASAQRAVRAFVDCVRADGTKVSTDSNSPRSPVLELGNGVVMRVTWKANGADGYVSTRKNVRAIAGSFRRRVHVYRRRLVIVYDKAPTKAQRAHVQHCATVKGLT